MLKGKYETEEHVFGDTRWVALRAHGAEWSWLTPKEAVELGRAWLAAYEDKTEPNAAT